MPNRAIKILGTPVACVTYQSVLEIVQKLAREPRPTAVCPANTHILAEARQEPDFARVMEKFGRKVYLTQFPEWRFKK
jgi:N-acetylglucosaminyldiphosphoundecaprenol N-acetyl-beta-D-mannosaminyltransferase